MDGLVSFGAWLKQRRKALHLTQDALARQVGCALVTIEKLESDARRPSTAVAERLALVLEVSPPERGTFIKVARAELSVDHLSAWPKASPGAVRGSVPVSLTPLIGRAPEVLAVCRLLQRPEVRLVTLSGAGGIGKTRLALQAAATLRDDFADGVCFVALAPIMDPTLVGPAVARALGIRELDAQPLIDSLTTALHDKQVLLVLDNFEHVLAAAPLVADLLTAAPQLKVLATSRAILGIYGEHDFLVPPLALPDPTVLLPLERLTQYAAIQLFFARARAATADVAVTAATAQLAAEICYRLDGLPLAIELAAARLRVLPPHALLHRLSSRLQLLTAGPRTVPARQQTLRATIDWSYDLLSPREQLLFARLAVFVGGCTVAAVEAVCRIAGDPALDGLDGLQALVDQRLLLPQEHSGSAAAGEARFVMLETVREYALERLDQQAAVATVRQQHAAYYLTLVEAAAPQVQATNRGLWLERLEQDHDNVRAALAWSQGADGSAELGARLAAALAGFWQARGYHSEGRRWFATVLARSGPASTARLVALLGAGTLAWFQDDLAQAQQRAAEADRLAGALGDRRRMAAARYLLGLMALVQGDHGQARMLAEASLTLSRELNDTAGIARGLRILGGIAEAEGNQPLALALAEESLARFREAGSTQDIAWELMAAGKRAIFRRAYGRATVLLDESLAVFQDAGDHWGRAWTLIFLGASAGDQGDHRRATALLEESRALFRAMGNKAGLTMALHALGENALLQGDDARARTLEEESLALACDLENTFDMSWSLVTLGYVAQHERDHRRARSLFQESLSLSSMLGNTFGIAVCLAGLGGVAAGEGAAARAVRLLATAAALHEALPSSPVPAHRRDIAAAVAASQAQLGEEGFAAAWAEGRALVLEQAIAYGLEGRSVTAGRHGSRPGSTGNWRVYKFAVGAGLVR